MRCKVLVLAAGQSRRFDGIKMLATIGGQSLINHSLSQLAASELSEIYPVVGHYADQILPVIPEKFSPVVCRNAVKGMGHSIAEAVAAVEQDASHIMIVLADQVALRAEDYNRLLKQNLQKPEAIVCARFEQQLSAPAIFPLRYFPALKALSGDKGAKKLLLDHSDNLVSVELPGARFDLDTRADLANWTTHETDTNHQENNYDHTHY